MSLTPRSRLPLVAVVPLAAASLLPAGCTFLAQQPDTPARHVRFQDLNQPAPPSERYYLLVFGAQPPV